MLNTDNASAFYLDSSGHPLQNGVVYFGLPGLNPATNPVTVFWDSAGTQPAAQPVAIANGRTVRQDGTPSRIWVVGDYSKLVQDAKGRQVVYETNQPQPPTVQQSVTDRFSGTGAPATFTLSATPADATSLDVYVAGVYQQKNSYTLLGNQLTITAAAAANNVEAVTRNTLNYANVAQSIATSLAAATGGAAAATASAAAASHIYAGTYATDPTTRPDGTAIQVGDVYFSSTANLTKRFNGATWVASDINTANLAASSGSTLIGWLTSWAGGVARTIWSKLFEDLPVTPLDFMTSAQRADVLNKTGSLDVTGPIQSAITAAAGRKLKFPNGTYKFTSPLTISGIDVDFDGSDLFYAGAAGSFALTLNSDASGGTCGNGFDNFTLYQSNFGAYSTFSASVAYDPPSIAAGAVLSNVTPGGTSTTVSVPGATVGGYARATLTTVVDGIVLTAWVSAPDVVTVWLSNYSNAPVDMASGTLAVTVVNNAFHGLCLGGSLGKLRNPTVRGFTGVSLGMGDGRDVTSGVAFSGSARCYYWDMDANLSPAAGWGMVVPPRNNENSLALSVFAFDAYGDSVPKRANTINQMVIGGITNRFRRLSLEGTSSESTVVLQETSNMCEGVGYIEYNTNYVVPGVPRIEARAGSSANRFKFRHPYGGTNFVSNKGTANDLEFPPAFGVNGQQFIAPNFSRNLCKNGNFVNGLTNWSDFSSGNVTAVTGTGALSGKRVRIDLTAGRPNLQQTIDTVNGIPIAGLVGQSITVSCFIKTNIANVKPRLAGITGQGGTSATGSDEFVTCTMTVPTGAASLPLSITTDASGLTGFLEISDVTVCIGWRAMVLGAEEQLVGSATYNPPSLATGAIGATTTVSVPGAALGDHVVGVSFSLDTQGVNMRNAWVSAADTVSMIPHNPTAGTIDLASGTLRVRVQKA